MEILKFGIPEISEKDIKNLLFFLSCKWTNPKSPKYISTDWNFIPEENKKINKRNYRSWSQLSTHITIRKMNNAIGFSYLN